jgi:hypothetical protein
MNAVRVEQAALRRPADELESVIGGLEDVALRTTESRRDLETLLEMETRQLVATVEADLATLRRTETVRLLEEAHALLDAHPRPRSAGADLDTAVKESLRRTINAWREAEARRIGNAFRDATNRFTEETDSLMQRTTRLCAELLDVELSAPVRGEPFAAESGFTFAFFDPPDSLEMTIAAIRRNAPARLARRMLRTKLDDDIPVLVDKHCGRLRWDFYQRLERGRIELTGELAARLDDTLDGIQRGVTRARQRHDARDRTEISGALDKSIKRLGTIAEVLRRIGNAAGQSER